MDDLLDNAPCGFLRLADDGRVLLSNTTLQRLLGYEGSWLEGTHVDALLAPGARIFYQTHVFPLLRMHGKVDEVYLSLRTASGTDVPVLVNAVRHEKEGGGVNDWIIVVMHRRNQFEDELLQAKKAAEEANRTKARFLSMLSHDLRAPLSAISMKAEILSTGAIGPVTDRHRNELLSIKETSQYVLRLVKDLLNYARLQSSRIDIREASVSLENVLTHASDMVQHLVDEAGLSLAIEGCLPTFSVTADPDRLQQVILNLLSNAIKFTDHGGRVTLACEQQDEQILLHVRDTGCGIPADQLDHIFDPFIQLNRSATNTDSTGVGLGLAISRELMRAMGGNLIATSQLGQGSTFTIILQATAPINEAEPVSQA